MYTQCPECSVAFRVTAEVLKMAAGKVRCGGCGAAFNALDHLSETKPAPLPPPTRHADPELPELSPDKPVTLEADTPPKTISAAQSAALLKTLDELAGEDIRIEDTGVEWRVLDAGEEPGDVEPRGTSRAIDEMLFDDNTGLPEDFDAIDDLPAPPRPPEPPAAAPEPDAPQFDLDLSDPDEWDDLLGDLDGEPGAEPGAAPDTEPDYEPVARPPDMDTQFALQAEAMGIDINGSHEIADADHDDEPDTSIEQDLMAAAFETEAAGKTHVAGAMSKELVAADDEPDELDFASDPVDAGDADELEIDLQPDADDGEIEDDVDDIALGFDDTVEKDIATLSMALDEDEDDPGADGIATRHEDHVIPEMSEEEKTINLMIDQELFNIAVEDEDGFASTIVQIQPDKKVDEEIEDNRHRFRDDVEPVTGRKPAAVETIIMEGEFVRAELDRERINAEKAAASNRLDSPGASLPLNREKDDYERRREVVTGSTGIGTWAGIAALVLLLIGQSIHQSRQALATVPAFNATIGAVYRLFGQPLAPAWNIAGWRFEATKGDTDESGELLTIYSRVGNNSRDALPYPLVHLALTDRFEDVIGSTVLEPSDYLPENADPRTLVPPGNTFNAVISIESPSADATGFKLNVCYRLSAGRLRCADQDFK